jgi:hypothetical protein
MKQTILISLIFLNSAICTIAQNFINQQIGPWTSEVGFKYNMPVAAQVNKDGSLFKPDGLVLGVFKDGLCHSVSAIRSIPAPGGKGFVLTVGCNNESETGFKYNVFDPATNLIYDVSETLDFKSLQALGTVIAPIQLTITGVSAVENVEEQLVKVFPNPIQNEYILTLDVMQPQHISMVIVDVSGKQIHAQNLIKLTGNNSIKLKRDASIPNGIYFLQLKVDDKMYNKKLIFN